MQDNEKKPALRFKGFTDPWEQRKLGEITEELSDYATQESGLPLLTSSRSGLIYQDEYRDSRTTKSTETLFSVVPVGVCTYRHMSDDDVFHMNINKLEKGLVSREYPVYKATDANDLKFVVQHINSCEEFKAFCAEQKKGGTRTRLYYNTLCQFSIRVPKLEEQTEISQYLDKLDTLITLHQRKYEKLVNIKKSMLDKMFPKNGASVPEIRFKGFTDPWEQRKLTDIADKVTEKNASLEYIETLTNSAEYGIISQRDFFDHDISKMGSLSGYYVVRNEDFVYNPRISTTAPVGPINRNKLGRTGVMSPLYTVFRPHDIDTTYLEYFFKSGYWHSFMYFNGDSGARSDRFSIKDTVLFEMPVPQPKIEEQKKIGKYLTELDTLITLHQRKLEKLQNIKKSCLEKMFV